MWLHWILLSLVWKWDYWYFGWTFLNVLYILDPTHIDVHMHSFKLTFGFYHQWPWNVYFNVAGLITNACNHISACTFNLIRIGIINVVFCFPLNFGCKIIISLCLDEIRYKVVMRVITTLDLLTRQWSGSQFGFYISWLHY